MKTTNKNTIPTIAKYLISITVWLFLWHFAADGFSMKLFLPLPREVFQVLGTELLVSADFWLSIRFSLLHIGAGFLGGAAAGIILAILSYLSQYVEIFLWFPIRTMQSIPVASFVILLLLCLPTDRLSIIIPLLMVLPILYTHTLTALKETDRKLLEMAWLFKIPWWKKIRYIYIPAILPQILSACTLGIGLAWKSGIAAEIIGMVQNSMGNQLYKAKIYLMTPELFAWTLVIIILSIVCEQFMKQLTHLILKDQKEVL